MMMMTMMKVTQSTGLTYENLTPDVNQLTVQLLSWTMKMKTS